MITTYLLAFLASFVFVFLKSWQQQNVTHRKYWWILPTSMFMAATEVLVIATVVKTGYGLTVIAIGLGAGLGAMLATYIHATYLGKK